MQVRKLDYGFTLIEILIVVVIIGITVSFAVLAFGDFGEKRKVILYSEQFADYVTLVKKEAILESQTLGIKIQTKSYTVMRFHNNKWSNINSNIFKRQVLPHGIEMYLKRLKVNQAPNLIIINAAGNISPFQVLFGKSKNKLIASVAVGNTGEIKVSTNDT